MLVLLAHRDVIDANAAELRVPLQKLKDDVDHSKLDRWNNSEAREVLRAIANVLQIVMGGSADVPSNSHWEYARDTRTAVEEKVASFK